MLYRYVAEIVTDIRQVGERLPKEVELAAEFGASRGVARECIRALEERGLVTVTHGVGAIVNGTDQWDVFDAEVLTALLDSRYRGEIAAELLEVRRLLAINAAGLAAVAISESRLALLESALASMELHALRPVSPSTQAQYLDAELDFHQIIASATGSRVMAVLSERIHSALALTNRGELRSQDRNVKEISHHRSILRALERHDAQAAQDAMAAHLDAIAASVLKVGVDHQPADASLGSLGRLRATAPVARRKRIPKRDLVTEIIQSRPTHNGWSPPEMRTALAARGIHDSVNRVRLTMRSMEIAGLLYRGRDGRYRTASH